MVLDQLGQRICYWKLLEAPDPLRPAEEISQADGRGRDIRNYSHATLKTVYLSNFFLPLFYRLTQVRACKDIPLLRLF